MPALASPATWRQHHYADGFLFILRPTVIFQARVNMATITYPLTSLTFDTVTVGAYGDIKPGMTLLLGSSAGAEDLGRQRVRAAATATTIPIGRTPKGNHRGELNVADNMYITILKLYEVWSKIPYITSTGVSYKDETAFAANIAQPPIANGGCAVADFVDSITGKLTVNFSASNSQIVDSTSSSLTYAWDFDQGDTSSSATPTGIQFDPGSYDVRLTVNDGTRSHTTHIPVYAGERTGVNAPFSVETDALILKPEGPSMNFVIRTETLDLGDYPYGTLVIYFEDEFYGMVQDSLSGPTGREKVKFVGWLGSEPTAIQYSGTGPDKRVTLQAHSVSQKLAKLPGFGQIVDFKNSPTTWQQMKAANIDRYLHHLLHWHSTALEVAPFQWSGQGSNYPFTELSSDGMTLYEQVDQRARAITYRLTCTRRGELLVRADPQRQPSYDRTSTVIVALTDNDWSSTDYDATPEPTTHWVNGSAIIASSSQVKSVFCIAPGATPGQGSGEQDVNQQLVRTQAELNARVGHDYARLNASMGIVRLNLTHGGDAGLDPAYMEWVQWGISATVAAQRGLTVTATTRWLLLENQISSDHRTHVRTQVIQIERETSGLDAETYTPPPVSTQTPTYPAIPITDTYSNWPEDPSIIFPPDYPIIQPFPLVGAPQIDYSGNIVLMATDSWVGVTTSFKRTNTLPCRDITPDLAVGETVIQAIRGFGVDAYVLVSDGSNSRVFHTDNMLAATVEWTAGAAVAGSYQVIRLSGVDGAVYIEGITLSGGGGGGSFSHTFDFTLGTQGWIPVDAAWATHDGSNGWRNKFTDTLFSYVSAALYIEIACNSINIDGVDIDYAYTEEVGTTWGRIQAGLNGGLEIADNLLDGAHTFTQNFATPNVTTSIRVLIDVRRSGSIGSPGNCWIPSITVRGSGSDPFGVSTQVAYSDDYGATFNTPESVSASLTSEVGFDTIKIGTVSLVGSVGQVQIATTAGGSYSAYGDPFPTNAAPEFIWIPRYTFAGGSNAGTSTPQYYAGSMALSDVDEALWRVTSSGTVFTNITPVVSATPGTIVGRNALIAPWKNATKVAALFDFGVTRRLMTSTNSGTSWSNRGTFADSAYIRMRNSDPLFKELYISGSGEVYYSKDFGVTIVTKTLPVSGQVVSIEVVG